MAFHYVKGGTSDAYIRDRLPIRPVTRTLYEWGDEGYPVKPAFIWLTNGPLSAFHGDDPVAVDCKHCAPLEIVERVVDATGIELLGYDDHAFALEPKYAGLPIDLTVDENQRGFRSNRSAAYCGLHATVAVYSDPALLDAYDVGCILSGIVATATRVIEGDAR